MLVHFRRRERERESRGDFNFGGVGVEVGETPPPAVGRRRGEERRGEERTLERREKSARAADFTGIDRERETETETRDPFCEAIGASKIKYLLAPVRSCSPSRMSSRPQPQQSWRCVPLPFHPSHPLTTHDHGRRRHRGFPNPPLPLFLLGLSPPRVSRVRY